MRCDLGTLDSDERSLPFGLRVSLKIHDSEFRNLTSLFRFLNIEILRTAGRNGNNYPVLICFIYLQSLLIYWARNVRDQESSFDFWKIVICEHNELFLSSRLFILPVYYA